MGRILIIRGGAIGDFVLTLPAIALLRENFPNAWIEILGYRHIVALAEGRFYADASRSIEYAPLSRFFVPNAELDPGLVEYFGSFQQIISYLFDPDGFFEANLRRCGVKNLIVASPKVNDSDHAAKQLARPLEEMALFLEEPGAALRLSEEDGAAAQAFLGGVNDLLALHPGSGGERKNWPLECWMELASRLAARAQALVICEGEADAGRGERIATKIPNALLAKGLPLPTLAAILSKSRLFLGHDSGISHIAAATGAPCVLIFGPTDPDVWAPANPQVRTIAAPAGQLGNLTVESVEAVAIEVLRG